MLNLPLRITATLGGATGAGQDTLDCRNIGRTRHCLVLQLVQETRAETATGQLLCLILQIAQRSNAAARTRPSNVTGTGQTGYAIAKAAGKRIATGEVRQLTGPIGKLLWCRNNCCG